MMELISQMAMALALVLLLILLLAFAYRRRQKASSLIGLMAYQSIGQKMGVAALRIGSEVLVLGITPTDFKLLKRLDGQAAGLAPSQPQLPAGNSGRTDAAQADTPEAGIDNLADKVARLRRIKEDLHG